MRKEEFFNGISDICPFQEIEDDDWNESNMEPIPVMCSMNMNFVCSSKCCKIVQTMADVTTFLRGSIARLNMLHEGFTILEFYNLLTVTCPHIGPVCQNKSVECKIDSEIVCDDELCPVIGVMVRYVEKIKKKKRPVVIPEGEGWLEITRENAHHQVWDRDDTEVTSLQSYNHDTQQLEIKYFYRVIKNV